MSFNKPISAGESTAHLQISQTPVSEKTAQMLGKEIKEYKATKPITLFQRVITWIKGGGWINRGKVAEDLNKQVTNLHEMLAKESLSQEDRGFIATGITDLREALSKLKEKGLTEPTRTRIIKMEDSLKIIETDIKEVPKGRIPSAAIRREAHQVGKVEIPKTPEGQTKSLEKRFAAPPSASERRDDVGKIKLPKTPEGQTKSLEKRFAAPPSASERRDSEEVGEVEIPFEEGAKDIDTLLREQALSKGERRREEEGVGKVKVPKTPKGQKSIKEVVGGHSSEKREALAKRFDPKEREIIERTKKAEREAAKAETIKPSFSKGQEERQPVEHDYGGEVGDDLLRDVQEARKAHETTNEKADAAKAKQRVADNLNMLVRAAISNKVVMGSLGQHPVLRLGKTSTDQAALKGLDKPRHETSKGEIVKDYEAVVGLIIKAFEQKNVPFDPSLQNIIDEIERDLPFFK